MNGGGDRAEYRGTATAKTKTRERTEQSTGTATVRAVGSGGAQEGLVTGPVVGVLA